MRLLLLAVQLAGVAAAAPRDVVSFDFQWKHTTGLTEHPAPVDAQPPNATDPGDAPKESTIAYDDSAWLDVSLPHDGLVRAAPSTDACPDGCSGKSYIPRHVLWYRKTFALPSAWEGSAIWLDFDGSFRETTVWVNGIKVAFHDCGYTPFRVRLDDLNVTYGFLQEEKSSEDFGAVFGRRKARKRAPETAAGGSGTRDASQATRPTTSSRYSWTRTTATRAARREAAAGGTRAAASTGA